MTFATKHPGGFPDDQVAVLTAILPTLALLLEIQTLHRTTLTPGRSRAPDYFTLD